MTTPLKNRTGPYILNGISKIHDKLRKQELTPKLHIMDNEYELTGQFPVQSDRGNNYILVAYHYDANNILTTPLKNITVPCILNGITKIHDKLRKRGLTLKLHIMDNEVSEDLKQYFEDSDIQFQMVPPHMHERNSSERGVRTFKNHFIASLYTM